MNRLSRSLDTQDPAGPNQFGIHLQPMARSIQKRKLSCEEIINEMEQEQDAQVMRLLREVEMLREENMQLRKQLYQSNTQGWQGSRSQTDRELGFTMNDDYGINYHYGLSTGSTRSSLSYPNRRRSPVSMQSIHHRSSLPVDMATTGLSPNLKRGSNSITTTSSSASSVLADSDGGSHPLLRAGRQDVDPRLKVPRRWSSISDSHAGGGKESHIDTAIRLREYEFDSSKV